MLQEVRQFVPSHRLESESLTEELSDISVVEAAKCWPADTPICISLGSNLTAVSLLAVSCDCSREVQTSGTTNGCLPSAGGGTAQGASKFRVTTGARPGSLQWPQERVTLSSLETDKYRQKPYVHFLSLPCVLHAPPILFCLASLIIIHISVNFILILSPRRT